jgi:hypothetical protein
MRRASDQASCHSVETTNIVGTSGNYPLCSALFPYVNFAARVPDGKEMEYSITDNMNWEIGHGTLRIGTPDLIHRIRVDNSSNAGFPVNWLPGTKKIFLVEPPEELMALRAEIESALKRLHGAYPVNEVFHILTRALDPTHEIPTYQGTFESRCKPWKQ